MEELLEKERKARVKNDYETLLKTFEDLMNLCKSDEELVGLARVLTIKRGQNRMAIKWMIGQLFERKKQEKGFVVFFSSILREVIEGRIFLEEERIYITEELKKRYELSGDIKSALDVVINVPVETFTMVKESVVVNYQLEQLRLCVQNQDWIRADISMKKIRRKYFEENDTVAEKIKFYELIVLLHLGQRRYFNASDVYYSLSKLGENSTCYVVLSSFFCILTTCETEMEDVVDRRIEMLRKLSLDKNNDEVSRSIVNRFLSRIIIDRSMINEIQQAFSSVLDVSIYLNDLGSVIDEHNFRIVERFYSSISIQEISMVMQSSSENVIRKISFMVNNKFTKCKINQKTGIIEFRKRKWNDSVDDVMNKLIKCNHLIHKERLKLSIKRS
ncbi:26S proteasome regulatory complex component [Encephalitozoon intestinalis ATCC 50506]|uniref:26S proteasome regulatory complex component n=1 Tax=Encephalitozoon intestinalis (strain ATCC 50506) TaxID=876142 RepID=E0S6X3_ENCIT|nr:26S proteasome regulatory complex component [Encephalitozoon intestinalis ATCC 50506]ADM11559.1 26S proteasome regulatory complex component [Encephalitozoon intestinalis ATCC 50506]UTX45274.1 proteasome regulatory complex component [Encephalitozoon intestinalis]